MINGLKHPEIHRFGLENPLTGQPLAEQLTNLQKENPKTPNLHRIGGKKFLRLKK